MPRSLASRAEECLLYFDSLIKETKQPAYQPFNVEVAYHHWTDELGRFRTWLKESGASLIPSNQQSLDHKVRDLEHIASAISGILKEMRKVLKEAENTLSTSTSNTESSKADWKLLSKLGLSSKPDVSSDQKQKQKQTVEERIPDAISQDSNTATEDKRTIWRDGSLGDATELQCLYSNVHEIISALNVVAMLAAPRQKMVVRALRLSQRGFKTREVVKRWDRRDIPVELPAEVEEASEVAHSLWDRKGRRKYSMAADGWFYIKD